ncbi:cytochrome c biogenesis protein CcdA [Rubrobacter tropicus]|uniref:Cytochrome c biogenesis protein CcdA n=1 Tax=Rubrobacter tropicus TaxID=2653851 RepID=A0A6G8Q447_9ACTN|nr:cytochrome c biogenesis CcdA family protein [Rubrobacter tropicus]QIN81236.1 cytochrome c biogenesis protein CcdA [Rubrobacter tropicus]
MVEVSLLASFLGGLLSLLSPCSALLLPAFFAYAFQSRFELVWRTGVFFWGLVVTLVPLGMGLAAVSRLVYGYRGTLILVSGLIIIALGILQIAGRGFSFVPSRFGGAHGDSVISTFALGAVYGFAGFCSGPILGAVLTVAASSGSPIYGAGLLATYAAGMAAPLFGIALLWDRFDLGRRRWLRGREITLPGGVGVHSTNLVSGVMFILLGTLFIAFQGTSALEGFYAANGATDLAFAAERWVNGLAESIPLAVMLALAAILFAAVVLYKALRRLPRRGKKRPADHKG